MRPFQYHRAGDDRAAIALAAAPGAHFLAGGTTLVDLMKLDVMRPTDVIDINDLAREYGGIRSTADGLRLGALARMSDVAGHPAIREDYPVVAQSLDAAASVQLRHMATLGGNVLQRTRCGYFRDPHVAECNKRSPGSGCAALDGVNRRHAILGTSPHCIAAYPGDFAQALVALDAAVRILGPAGERTVAIEELHRAPGDTPHIETTLAAGELIVEFILPIAPWTRRSAFVKVRDRESYEFALASAAVALDVAHGDVRKARIALGGVATKPWRARDAERSLLGRPMNEPAAVEAAEIAFAGVEPRPGNAFKVELGRRTLVRALMQTAVWR
jgi:xanthine dehydrogenase YagS FAD-binding subunit